MRILITGAGGTLGAAITTALAARGHAVVALGRNAGRLASAFAPWPGIEARALDLTQATEPTHWMDLLDGIDCVVNAAGIFREQHAGDFTRIHHQAPAALFHAAQEAGVHRILQLSALGAAANAPTRFLRSKHEADSVLHTLAIDYCILKPSLVFTPQGASTRLFSALARLPLQALPGGGSNRVQPIHLDDLVEAMVRLTEQPTPLPRELALVGPMPLPLADYLDTLRARLGGHPAWRLPLPSALASLGAALAEHLPGSLISRDSLRMLAHDNTADPAPLAALLGHALRPPAQFLPAAEAAVLCREAGLFWTAPLARLSLALLWLTSGALSLWPGNREIGLGLLADSAIPEAWQLPLLIAASLTDLALGVATLWRPTQRLWQLQLCVVGFYSLFVAWRLPELLLHPFTPILKNLPIIALILLLMALHRGR